MGQVFFLLLVILLVVAAIQALIPVVVFVAVYVLLPLGVLWLLFALGIHWYHYLNPAAKARFLAEQAAKKASEKAKKAAELEEDVARLAKRRRHEEELADQEAKHLEHLRLEAEDNELIRQAHRDADRQDVPYVYQIGTHGNESLAIRYGIANNTQKTKEHWYTVRGGEQRRNPSRDRQVLAPSETICLQKIAKVDKDMYRVNLKDYSDREAIAVIEPGAEYVKTFYPLDKTWFAKHADLELTLKGNGTFTLKELATFHVQKAVGRAG